MAKQFQLNIPEPCHEEWNKMTAAEKGRFCNSCQKQVVDFTGMSDSQLVAFFRKPSTGSICGRFMQDQLDRDMFLPKKRIPWLKYFFQVALPAFLLSSKASAQGKVNLIGDTTMMTKRCGITGAVAMITPEQLKDEALNHTITGRVQGISGNGIGYASIVVKGTNKGTMADSIGNFRLTYGRMTELKLEVSSIGYRTREMVLNLSELKSSATITLSLEENITLGFVVIAPVAKKKKSIPLLPQKLVDTASKYFKIFPNPVMPGTPINIEWTMQEEGYYSLMLIDQSGKLVHQREIWIDAEARMLNFELPFVSAGHYFLSIVNKRTGKKFTEKIMVREH